MTELEAGKTYTISSLEELERLTELVNDPDTNQASRETKYELLEDIDNAGNIMIGTGAENPSESVKSYFKGSFNGNGHVIRGLAITADPDSMKGQEAVQYNSWAWREPLRLLLPIPGLIATLAVM